jgi:hypothetical protein
MRRILQACICLCLGLVPLASAQTQSSSPGAAWKNHLRSVRIEKAKITKQNDEYVEGPRVLEAINVFAPDSSSSEYTNYDPDGSVNMRVVTTFNSDGDKTSISLFAGTDVLRRKIVYAYKERRLVEEATFNGDGSQKERRVLTWDDTGLSEVKVYGSDNSLTRRQVKTRNPQTGQYSWQTYSPDGAKIQARAYDYQQGPKVSEFTDYNANGTTANKTVMTRDAGQSQTDRSQYNPDGKLLSQTSEKCEHDSYGYPSKCTTYERDEKSGKLEPVMVTYYTATYY